MWPSHSLRKHIKSLSYAWAGIAYIFKTQANFRLHLVTAALCIILGAMLNLTPLKWAIGLLCISFVLILEMVNTAFEVVVDHLWREEHPKAKIIKDVSAGFVLVSALTVLVIGLIVFLPALFAFFYPA